MYLRHLSSKQTTWCGAQSIRSGSGWGAYRLDDSIDFILTITLIGVAALHRPRPYAEPSIFQLDGAIELAPGNAIVLYNDLNSRRDFAMTRFPRPNAVAMESLVWLFTIVTSILDHTLPVPNEQLRYLLGLGSAAYAGLHR